MASFLFMRIALLVLLVAASAAAAPKKDAKSEEGKKHFKQAQTYYNLGRFDDALTEFSAAYEATRLPALLFNIGQCHRQLKNWERALFFYEGFLREGASEKQRPLVEESIAEAKRELEKEAAAARAKKEEEERLAAITKPPVEAIIAAPADPIAQPPPTARVEASEESVYEQWWFWAIIGGVVVGGTAVTYAAWPSGNGEPQLPPAGSVGTLDRRLTWSAP
jgi:tetratricopeptide (TPR) repeat protein